MPPRFKLTAPIVREPVLHKQIADGLRIELAPPGRISPAGVVWWSVDIAAYAGTVPGLRTARGVIAGIPDLLVLFKGHAHFIELKADDGSLSPAQQDVAVAVIRCGCGYGVARNILETLALLDRWEIPRARRLHIAGLT